MSTDHLGESSLNSSQTQSNFYNNLNTGQLTAANNMNFYNNSQAGPPPPSNPNQGTAAAPSTAAQLFANSNSSTYPNQPPPPVNESNFQENQQSGHLNPNLQQIDSSGGAASFFNSNELTQPTNQQQTMNSYSGTDIVDSSNFHGYQTVEPQVSGGINLQNNHFSNDSTGFFDQYNNAPVDQAQNELQKQFKQDVNSKTASNDFPNTQNYFEQAQESEQNQQVSQTNNENLYGHYGYSGPENTGDGNRNQTSHQLNEETQSGGSSGSCSSYAMVSSVKSLESESRLSPYQFVDNTVYPSQSSLNSNESSPLEIQNMSTNSATYDKVSMPSGSMTMSSFEMTGSTSSSDLLPLQSTPSVVEAIEEASEPITEPVKPFPNESDANPLHENKKKLMQKAAALFEEAKQINTRTHSLSSSGSQSMEYHSNVRTLEMYSTIPFLCVILFIVSFMNPCCCSCVLVFSPFIT